MNGMMRQQCGGCNREAAPKLEQRQRISKKNLYEYINEISFAFNDITLYLDTHPDDLAALEYFQKCRKLRNQALEDYAQWYGPLTLDTAECSREFTWATQKWPWEGGGC